MNSTSIGNISLPFPRGGQVAVPRNAAMSNPGGEVESATPGLRRLAAHRPNQAHAVLTYGTTTLHRHGGPGANVDIYV